ncbi:MAG: putative type I restriction enzymeP M protein [Microgenomates group bacterium ADurb.Bin219]|nr:MAG: putative type I restriction enzymeP M protein [Microgenomates group bacterium ADurb.Bin219]
MLTQETKRKIDSARQILVGKVPDPKAQIDQITTALIYKFMDDMDKDAMELGGKARFFTNGFEKYAWSKILDPKLGGHERLELYGEAITKLWQNNHLPQLFRDIFKDAFLPYRSPETLSLFLKEINGFTYSHSEDLGDAFEYLLSIMSSQGDAGQFRTPRHIIDFIVEVVDPKKDESILDPACGTAGFLISAYKHILEQHDGLDDPEHKEKPLTPDEKKKLMGNLFGYDISPDMVKLSKVNMYLHGFAEPKIYEYDTLSSDEKWDEMYDVIMANPPFMSPKGGIRPHKRFSVQANRAEVLFVDYIKEHLRPNGRAGVIVPEGIIFQSGTAYKQLRKLLVEDGLFAVVSLPSGVFNPYSGVKTSILFFDSALSKRSKDILFIKIENDGFDLGAQRRPVAGGELEIVASELLEYKNILSGTPKTRKSMSPLEIFIQDRQSQTNNYEPPYHLRNFLLVPKSKIEKDGDYNLSGDRYKEAVNKGNQKWSMVELGEVSVLVQRGKSPKYGDGGLQVIKSGQARGYFEFDFSKQYFVTEDFVIDHRKLEVGDLLINSTGVGTAGRVTLFNLNGAYLVDSHITIVRLDQNRANPVFVLYALVNEYGFKGIEKLARGNGGQIELSLETIKTLKIPLPPIEVQKEIVKQIEDYQKIIDGAKQMVENWLPIPQVDPKWPMKLIKEVAQVNPAKPAVKEWLMDRDVSFLPMSSLSIGSPNPFSMETRKLKDVIKGYTSFQDDDILLAKITPCFENGKLGIVKNLNGGIGFGSTEFIVIRANKDVIHPLWIWLFIYQKEFIERGKNFMTGSAGQKRVPASYVENYQIPVPDLDSQTRQIKKLQMDFDLINELKRKVIPEFEEKIKRTINEINE